MRDTYNIEKPSQVLAEALFELENYSQKSEKPKKGFLYCLKNSIREYHPLISQRVANVAYRVDKK